MGRANATYFWIDPKEQVIGIIPMSTRVGILRTELPNSVYQASWIGNRPRCRSAKSECQTSAEFQKELRSSYYAIRMVKTARLHYDAENAQS